MAEDETFAGNLTLSAMWPSAPWLNLACALTLAFKHVTAHIACAFQGAFSEAS